jgi:hypothetical protein
MEKKEEFKEDSSLGMDEIEEINSNRAIFRKYPELYDDEWPD